MTTYLKMDAGDMLQALGQDAHKWADAFLEAFPTMEHDVMVGWFANAIMNSFDVQRAYLVRHDDALMDHLESLFSHRGIIREIDLMPVEQEA